MYLFYRGFGFLVPLFTVAAAMMSGTIGDKAIFPVATVLSLIAGLLLKRKREVKVDTFFFIPVLFWPVILAIVSLVYFFTL